MEKVFIDTKMILTMKMKMEIIGLMMKLIEINVSIVGFLIILIFLLFSKLESSMGMSMVHASSLGVDEGQRRKRLIAHLSA